MAFAGDTLVDVEYVPVEIVAESDGRHWGYSETLEFEFWWEEGMLRYRDPASGRFLVDVRGVGSRQAGSV